jgi:two-component system response regulator
LPKQFHILIVDDDDDDQLLIRETISRLNCPQLKVSSVFDGVEMLEYLYKTNSSLQITPDIILLDIAMPKMDGFQVLKKLKADPGFRKIPVFVISTSRNFDRIETSMELGASNFYSKPGYAKGYQELIAEILSNSFYSAADCRAD